MHNAVYYTTFYMTINLSILDFKSAQYKETNGDVMAINLSILDFKLRIVSCKMIIINTINLSILDFKFCIEIKNSRARNL